MTINLLDLFLFVVPALHVISAPFTKVEESFNLHATHDVLMYGVQDIGAYDHFTFPGVVPRTFIGSLALAWLSTPMFHVAKLLGIINHKLHLQIGVRLTLALCNSFGLWCIRRATTRRFGTTAGNFFTILTCTQFHLPYWMGRTLPNMFALLPVNVATALLVLPKRSTLPEGRRWITAIALVSATGVIFRAELAALLGPLFLQCLISSKCHVVTLFVVTLVATLGALVLTVGVDSYFWKTPYLWPEFQSIYFNVVEGKSADWGVSPIYSYFTSSLPKLLLASEPLALLGTYADSHSPELAIAPFVFVALMSLLSHKEWRFIIYIVPLVNVLAARGATWIYKQRHRHPIIAIGLLFVLQLNIAVTGVMTVVSRENYPGGDAMQRLNARFRDLDGANVYINNLAAQTGASLFLHTFSPPFSPFLEPTTQRWTYVKTENETEFTKYDLILAEPQELHSKGEDWNVVEVIGTFNGRIHPGGWLPGGNGIVDLKDALFVLSPREMVRADNGSEGEQREVAREDAGVKQEGADGTWGNSNYFHQ